MNEIASIISTIGFPCVMCVMMYSFSREMVNNMVDTISKEMTNTREVLVENTEAVRTLCDEIREAR